MSEQPIQTMFVFWRDSLGPHALAAIQWDGMTDPLETLRDYAKQYDFDFARLTYTMANNIPQPKPRKSTPA